MKPRGTLLLSREDIVSLLRFEDYIQGVEEAFRLHAVGKSLKPGLLHTDSGDGEFHIKTGGLEWKRRRYFGLKVNGGFFHNQHRFDMPSIQGAIVLCDGENGYPLAIMDSKEISRNRTGAATAVAAKLLARPDSTVVTICGCGNQGRIQLEALSYVLPIKKAYAVSRDRTKALSFALEMSDKLRIPVIASVELGRSAQESDICVTCTPAKKYFLEKSHVRAGTFVAAVGADSPDKQEIDPALLMSNKVITDLLDQCARVGELHHAVERGMPLSQVHAEIGQVIAGQKPGRTNPDEIIVFDSTGTALQDVAMAAIAYEKAVEASLGLIFDLQR